MKNGIAIYERMISGTQEEQHLLAVVGEEKKPEDKWSSLYSADVLNTSISSEEIVEMVKNAVEFEKTEDSFEKGIKLLFYGCSGAGKSRFAKYIAKELNMKIDAKNVSDILSKWVGESEKKLAEAFIYPLFVVLLSVAASVFIGLYTQSTEWPLLIKYLFGLILHLSLS